MTSPVEDDLSRTKKSQPTSDTASGLSNEQVKENTADDGIHDDSGMHLVSYSVYKFNCIKGENIPQESVVEEDFCIEQDS